MDGIRMLYNATMKTGLAFGFLSIIPADIFILHDQSF